MYTDGLFPKTTTKKRKQHRQVDKLVSKATHVTVRWTDTKIDNGCLSWSFSNISEHENQYLHFSSEEKMCKSSEGIPTFVLNEYCRMTRLKFTSVVTPLELLCRECLANNRFRLKMSMFLTNYSVGNHLRFET